MSLRKQLCLSAKNLLLSLLIVLLATCKSAPVNRDIILATTTSTQDTGLLDVLIPLFEGETGYKVKTVAVGSGQALKMGEEGNADVLLVHAPDAEEAFMENGFGVERHLVMHNDFLIVGPATDPAGIRETANAPEALGRIAAAECAFISRGDNSGTHTTELKLWNQAGLIPDGKWYQESGQGMGETLMIASEKSAYALTDRATYLAHKTNLALEILVEGDATLLNVYHVIVVNPAKWPTIHYEGARAFAHFLIAPRIQKVIAEFGMEEFGQPLFYADADKTEADLGLP